MFKQYKDANLNKLWAYEMEQKCDFVLREKEVLQKVLGKYYDDLYDFFLEIVTAKYEIKILIARRCLVLYQLFLQIFYADNIDLEIYGKVYSDRFILGNYEELKGKSVLLVDDILIHGRKVDEIYSDIKKNMESFGEGSIDIWVYMMTDCKKCISDETLAKIEAKEPAVEWEWKTLSDGIVSAIYAMNMPYTSFVGAYVSQDVQLLYNNAKNVYVIENSSVSQENVGCKTKILFSEQTRPKLFDILSYVECVRICESNGNNIVIPYVFTKALKSNSLNDFFEKFACLCEEFPRIKDELLNQNKGNTYRLRLFNALLCHIYGLYFFANNSYKPEIFGIDTLVKSYGEQIAEEFYKITTQQMQVFLEHDCGSMENYLCDDVKENTDLENIYKELLGASDNYDEIYLKCIRKHREKDEERAEENKKRLFGITTDYLFALATDMNARRECAKNMLGSMDTGCAAASYAKVSESNAYASCISPGEQSFRLILEKYAEIIRKMIFMEEQNLDIEAYLKFIKDALKLKEEQYSELEEFYRDNYGNLKNSNIVSILEEQKNWKIPDVKKYNQEYMRRILG